MLVVRYVSRHWQLCFEQNHYYGDILEVKGFFRQYNHHLILLNRWFNVTNDKTLI